MGRLCCIYFWRTPYCARLFFYIFTFFYILGTFLYILHFLHFIFFTFFISYIFTVFMAHQRFLSERFD
jgi:hypothetical protein